MQTIWAAVLAMGAAANAPAAKQASARENYGLAGGRDRVGCVVTHRKITRFPVAVSVVAPGPGLDPSAPLRGRIVSALSQPCERLEDSTVEPDEPAPQAYALRLDRAEEGVWSGMVAFEAAASASLRACVSREGVHFTAWQGRPLHSARLWHAYYYLDYEVEAGGETDCRKQDYAE